MSDDEKSEIKPFCIERAKQGRANCKKCKSSCQKGELRIAKLNPNNPFGEGPIKSWYHLDCFFSLKVTKNTKTLTSSDEIEGWNELPNEDKTIFKTKAGKDFKEVEVEASSSSKKRSLSPSINENKDSKKSKLVDDFNKFSDFQMLIKQVKKESSYNEKSKIIRKMIFDSKRNVDLELWLKLLMPKEALSRVYNLHDKQIVKLFSTILRFDQSELSNHLEESGDVSETVSHFFNKSKKILPKSESSMSLQKIDEFLDELQHLTHEKDQINHFEMICKQSTIGDLKTLIRLIKNDLKMNCRARHVLDAVHESAYEHFQKSRDLKTIINTFSINIKSEGSKKLKSGLQLMIPISPMLAEACKDFDKAIEKCVGGFYSEIKYDGERVQIHKKGNEFKFFSRNLKLVTDYKIEKFKDFLPKAFEHGNDLILDSEILMVDTKTDELLPFGTLGKHKKEEHKNAVACLFIFDCLYFNGEDLTGKSMKERRKFLEDNLKPIKHHIQLSEYKLLKTKNDLVDMTKEVLQKGLEGLVLKGLNTIYEPGKRRWFKVKKDYLLKGAIADTADLVILGAWFGSGKLGGIYSIFLMGCYDESNKLWKTVTKVHSGLDDKEMEEMHQKITPLMEKFDKNSKIPKWLNLNRQMIPNAIAKDVTIMPILEITGAEFTNSDIHTANSISIRFPRITKIRDDKSTKEATNLQELTHLFNESKSGVHLNELDKLKTSETKKRKTSETIGKNFEKKVKTNDEEVKIFSNFKLYLSEETTKKFKEIVENFQRFGGNVTSSSKSANLVIYENEILRGNLNKLRKLFTPDCKHLQISWLHDSINEKSLKDITRYYVKLTQI